MTWTFRTLAGAALFLASDVGAGDGGTAWISLTRTDSAAVVEAFAHLGPTSHGRYELVVTQSGPSGRSVSRQGGDVPPATADDPALLTVSRVSLPAGAELKAELTVTSSDGDVLTDSVLVKAE